MKKFYALHGRIITGKCTVIKMVYQQLLNTKGAVEIYKQKLHVQVVAVVEINGVKVGFISKGDKATEIRSNVKILVDNGCQIIIGASRTWGNTVDELRTLTNQAGFEPIQWIKKSIATTKDEADFLKLNTADALLLMNLLKADCNIQTVEAQKQSTTSYPVAAVLDSILFNQNRI